MLFAEDESLEPGGTPMARVDDSRSNGGQSGTSSSNEEMEVDRCSQIR